MIHRLVPKMREKRWGRVIQIGGGLAIQPIAMQLDYEASLAARHNLAVSLARELKDTGVTSNVVAPGAGTIRSVNLFDVRSTMGDLTERRLEFFSEISGAERGGGGFGSAMTALHFNNLLVRTKIEMPPTENPLKRVTVSGCLWTST
jgi:NAD(P)-dependent dehydrogenase (short-subunit alcohol dehydrogenase family)